MNRKGSRAVFIAKISDGSGAAFQKAVGSFSEALDLVDEWTQALLRNATPDDDVAAPLSAELMGVRAYLRGFKRGKHGQFFYPAAGMSFDVIETDEQTHHRVNELEEEMWIHGASPPRFFNEQGRRIDPEWVKQHSHDVGTYKQAIAEHLGKDESVGEIPLAYRHAYRVFTQGDSYAIATSRDKHQHAVGVSVRRAPTLRR